MLLASIEKKNPNQTKTYHLKDFFLNTQLSQMEEIPYSEIFSTNRNITEKKRNSQLTLWVFSMKSSFDLQVVNLALFLRVTLLSAPWVVKVTPWLTSKCAGLDVLRALQTFIFQPYSNQSSWAAWLQYFQWAFWTIPELFLIQTALNWRFRFCVTPNSFLGARFTRFT